jgi:predicted metal-binding membrane protein
VLLAVGMTDLRAMAAMTVTVTAERLSPSGQRLAKTIGRKINRV